MHIQPKFLRLFHRHRIRTGVKLRLCAHLRRDIGLPVFDHATIANARALAGLGGWM